MLQLYALLALQLAHCVLQHHAPAAANGGRVDVGQLQHIHYAIVIELLGNASSNTPHLALKQA